MAELEISICTAEPQKDLKEIIEAFQNETRTSVRLHYIDWGAAWTEFLQMTLYGRGPSVSETGTTWMSSLRGRNSLRAFTREEVRLIGGAGAFPKSIWESCLDQNTGAVLAIPWIVDTYLVYYRSDILARAGVNEDEAFRSIEDFEKTLGQIQALGSIAPLVLPTKESLSTIHNLASYIWSMGGDFVSKDGKSLTTDSPNARDGIQRYYGLRQFIPAGVQNLEDEECESAFLRGEAAVILRNPSLLHALKRGKTETPFRSQIKTAVQPGVPLIGGSNLVIWSYVPVAPIRSAVDFIRHMTSLDSQTAYFEESGMLPARLDALQRISNDQDYAPAFQSLLSGRDMPYVPLWGLIEDKLTAAFSEIWQALIANPDLNIGQAIADILEPVERRLNNTLAQ